jgi:hypothetical protein
MKTRIFVCSLIGVLFVVLLATLYYRQPFVKQIKHVKITVHAVQYRPNLNAEYIVIIRVRGKLTVEIIRGPGQKNTQVIKGQKAQEYLENVGLN